MLGEGPSMRNVARLDAGALPMVHAMQTRGIQVDLTHFATMERVLIQDMERITTEVQAVAGHYVNLASGPQVSTFLFKELGLTQARVKFTKSGDRESVENEVLVAIQHQHPVVAKILEFKTLDKLRGTYVVPIPKLAKRTAFGTWRIYPRFKTTRIPSGRFAAADPNLLAMPNRTKRGKEVCKGFITAPGWKFVSCDLSQIEPRVVAHRSQDPNLMAVYHNKEDIYSDLAIPAFKLADSRYQDDDGWHYPSVDKEKHRRPSKTTTLASIYRVTNKGLAEQMPVICKHCGVASVDHLTEGCTTFESLWNEDNCQDIINAFYLRYSRISTMQRIDDARARKFGYVWDEFGRLLHITAVRSVHEWVVSAALREGGNMPVQGTATGCLKLSMAQIQDELANGVYGSIWYPLLPIHDEILSEVRESEAEEIGEYICEVFRNCVRFRVPLEAEWAISDTWGQLVK